LVAALAEGSPVALVPAVMLVFGVYVIAHAARPVVIGDHDGLTTEGAAGLEEIPKSDIEGFRMVTTPPLGNCIHVLIAGDVLIPLDVTRRPAFLPRGKRMINRQLEQLRLWLRS
jgi:hypothetical protein